MYSIPTSSDTGGGRELAHRQTQDIDVRLMWHPADDGCTVVVESRADGTQVALDVGDRPALAVYRHPFAYAVSPDDSQAPTAA